MINDSECKFITPFGPTIMAHKCPEYIIERINDYVHLSDTDRSVNLASSSYSKNVPDLLNRGIENIFLFYDYCIESGICEYLEDIADIYCDHVNIGTDYKLSIVDYRQELDFPYCGEIKYADCWVNRYKRGDYTPLHKHGSELSGIIFLKIPKPIQEMSSDENLYETTNMGGVLHFSYAFDIVGNVSTWIPEHEEGTLLLFPSWLQHLVYPQTTDEERITFSFNLVNKNDFELRNRQFAE